ncbi:hypothetical protein ACVW19_000489 [Streptomyces sp. TE5632]
MVASSLYAGLSGGTRPARERVLELASPELSRQRRRQRLRRNTPEPPFREVAGERAPTRISRTQTGATRPGAAVCAGGDLPLGRACLQAQESLRDLPVLPLALGGRGGWCAGWRLS